jgi:hypothetical protein
MCYIDSSVDTTIRNLDEAVYRRAKARAALEGRKIGDLVNEALHLYLERSGGRGPTVSLGDLVPETYPKGSERLSEQVDDVAYAGSKATR